MRRIACLLAVACLLPFGARGAAAGTCTDDADATLPLDSPAGRYALPSTEPAALVVFAHGYRNRSDSWEPHLREAARRGAVAVAPDYTGIGPAPDNRGWNVTAGAADSIAAARAFLERCPSVRTVAILGVSMGGNTSGLAVAAGARRPDGTPLFDWWVDVEGVANVVETYLEARLVGASGNAYAAGAAADIEAEMGGPLEAVPGAYLERTVVARVGDIARSGLRGAVIVHGVDDGLVPYDQSRELAAGLAAAGIPLDMLTVLRRGEGEAGTTLSESLAGATGYRSPFAGHGWEGSTTHLVIRTGLERLWALLEGSAPGPYREFLVDGEAGTVP